MYRSLQQQEPLAKRTVEQVEFEARAQEMETIDYLDDRHEIMMMNLDEEDKEQMDLVDVDGPGATAIGTTEAMTVEATMMTKKILAIEAIGAEASAEMDVGTAMSQSRGHVFAPFLLNK